MLNEHQAAANKRTNVRVSFRIKQVSCETIKISVFNILLLELSGIFTCNFMWYSKITTVTVPVKSRHTFFSDRERRKNEIHNFLFNKIGMWHCLFVITNSLNCLPLQNNVTSFIFTLLFRIFTVIVWIDECKIKLRNITLMNMLKNMVTSLYLHKDNSNLQNHNVWVWLDVCGCISWLDVCGCISSSCHSALLVQHFPAQRIWSALWSTFDMHWPSCLNILRQVMWLKMINYHIISVRENRICTWISPQCPTAHNVALVVVIVNWQFANKKAFKVRRAPGFSGVG